MKSTHTLESVDILIQIGKTDTSIPDTSTQSDFEYKFSANHGWIDLAVTISTICIYISFYWVRYRVGVTGQNTHTTPFQK